LWHGAGWNFILWGAVHGLFLSLERWLPSIQLPVFLKNLLAHLYCFMVVHLAWVLFRAHSISDALDVYGQLFFGAINPLFNLNTHQCFILVIAGCALLIPSPWGLWLRERGVLEVGTKRIGHSLILLSLLLLCLGTLGAQGFNPFIYFRF